MSLVQAVSRNITTAGTTQTTTAISTSAHNCLLFCAVYNAGNAGVVTPSDSTSLTWVPVLNSPYSGGATGLTLGIWLANNITGNAANTFTFASTGNDTPTIIIAEFSGRDLNVPFDLSVTASDVSATTGAHTTGTIASRGGDDLLAFNVSSALAQTYAAGGLWAIPPNGTVTSATGYDAFVQYQNNANNGSISNAYSVTVTDKLDAFIVSLKPPALPYSDEWLDYFQEVPEVYEVRGNYQQFTLLPQIADVDFDWTDDAGETDYWVAPESGSAVVVPNVSTSATQQYYGEDAELYDEALETQQFVTSFQQVDNLTQLTQQDPWDWFQEIDDDEWITRDTDPLGGGNAYAASQPFEEYNEWDEDPDDFFADDFGNDDADQLRSDEWFLWDADEVDDWSVVDDGYLGFNFQAPTPITVEDAWDYGAQDEDDYAVPDDYTVPDNNPVIIVEDPSWWDEEPDQDDGTAHDLDAVGADHNPVITAEDPWDYWLTDDDDYFIVDEYVLVDVAVNATPNIEDAWDWFVTDDDDYVVLDDYQNVTIAPNPLLCVQDTFDHFVTDEDDWAIPDEVQLIDVASLTQYPVDDAWDWANTDDDEYYVNDDYASVNNTPIVVEDPWEHFLTDPDDELFLAIDTDQVSVPQPAAIEDPWDWTQDADDEEWAFRDMDAVQPLQALSSQTDGWDHFFAEDDEYYVADDYQIVDSALPPITQGTEDGWQWFDEDIRDDYTAELAGDVMPNSIYETNPAFIVYLRYRPFTVVWTPKVET